MTSALDKRMAAKAAVTPEAGWNVVVIDDFEPAGEELSTCGGLFNTRAEADAYRAKRAAAEPDHVYVVYGKKDKPK